MSTQIPTQRVTSPEDTRTRWASGLTTFAGVMMVVAGVFHVLAGIAGLVRDEVYVATPEYVYAFNLTGWGWTHLIVGALVAITGVALLQGQAWARVVGIGIASISLVANFLFIPYYPIWALLIIALDIAIIWALAVYQRELA
ncbi:MAG TPA: hypothetical protein VD813_10525 [Pseudonocardia sp.]|nr:hypothetical protein [Pseudonocardia sp.]